MINRRELNVPNPLLMAFEFTFLSETTGIPKLNLPIVRSTSNDLVIRRYSHYVDALLMAHDSHLSRGNGFK